MKKKILFVLSVLFGLMFLYAGTSKLFNFAPPPENISEEMVKDFQAMMEIEWLMWLIGLAETIGGILVMIPKTRALGALILFPLMVGIVLTNTMVDTSGLPIVIALLAVYIWILIDSKSKYQQLV